MPTSIERSQLRKLLDNGAQLVEVLPAQDYEEEHLPGAINIPLRVLDRSTAGRLDPHRPVIVYCFDYQ
jgi:rhodanese-related sulfurtransferase